MGADEDESKKKGEGLKKGCGKGKIRPTHKNAWVVDSGYSPQLQLLF